MPDKKHTAEQLRKAQEIVDQEEAVALERSGRRKRRRDEWSSKNSMAIFWVLMLLLMGSLYIFKPFGDFSQRCRPNLFSSCDYRPSPRP